MNGKRATMPSRTGMSGWDLEHYKDVLIEKTMASI
jgi:hypothetical protein